MNEIIENTRNLLVAVFGLVFVVLAITIAKGSRKAQYADTARTSFTAVVAMIFLFMGMGTFAFAAFGREILSALGI